MFNVAKQARQYDPRAEHAALWCAELRGVAPPARIHALPFVGAGERAALAPGYPAPVIAPPARWAQHRQAGAGGAGGGGGGKKGEQRSSGAKKGGRGRRRHKNRAHRGRDGKVFNTR